MKYSSLLYYSLGKRWRIKCAEKVIGGKYDSEVNLTETKRGEGLVIDLIKNKRWRTISKSSEKR